jgi:hypothetical protein
VVVVAVVAAAAVVVVTIHAIQATFKDAAAEDSRWK